jgi:DNA repair protein RecO
MKKHTVEAIVIKNVNYKDTHRIYTLMSAEKGKISAIARGVRKISSKRSGSLDSLNLVKIGITESNSGFYSITEVQVENSYSKLKQNLDLVFIGMYFVELVDVFLEPDHQNYAVYRLLKSAMHVLSKNPQRPEIVVNVFELRLLDELGLGLQNRESNTEVHAFMHALKTEKNLSNLMNEKSRTVLQANSLIKDHLKKMVETYAKFPRLNKFLTEVI